MAVACLLVLAPGAALAQEADPSPTPASSPSAEPITSPAGDWTVSAFDAWEQGLAEPLPDSQLLLRLLADGQLEGETACGRFSGGWSSDGAELVIGVAPSGNLGCDGDQTAEAIGLATALAAVTSWQAADSGVELRDAAGTTRVVLGSPAIGDPTGEWSVEQFRRPNGELRAPHPEGEMWLVLAEDGVVEGSSGCGSLVGEYAREGAGITLGPLEVESSDCEDALARAERQLLRALGEVVYWRQAGDGLTLLDGFDEPLVELVRGPVDEE
jgi:heat shock protein HslJ